MVSMSVYKLMSMDLLQSNSAITLAVTRPLLNQGITQSELLFALSCVALIMF